MLREILYNQAFEGQLALVASPSRHRSVLSQSSSNSIPQLTVVGRPGPKWRSNSGFFGKTESSLIIDWPNAFQRRVAGFNFDAEGRFDSSKVVALNQKMNRASEELHARNRSGDSAEKRQGIPKEVRVQVPIGQRNFEVKAACRVFGQYKSPASGEVSHTAVNVKFKTRVLGHKSLVECSIAVNVSKGSNAVKDIQKAVSHHVQMIAGGGLAVLQHIPNEYTSNPSGDMVFGPPGGHTLDGKKPKLYSKNDHTEFEDGHLTLRTGSGAIIQTTKERLKYALELLKSITFVVGPDGQKKPASKAQLNLLAPRFAAFTINDLKALKKNGVQVYLVDRNRTPKQAYPGPGFENPDWLAYYEHHSKAIVIPISSLSRKESSDTVLHEIGHAVSDARVDDTKEYILFGEKQIKTLAQSGAVRALYLDYAKKCGHTPSNDPNDTSWRNPANKSECWSLYALKDPHEYFAEGVTWFKEGGANRARLREKDEKFYLKLEKLFAEDEHHHVKVQGGMRARRTR